MIDLGAVAGMDGVSIGTTIASECSDLAGLCYAGAAFYTTVMAVTDPCRSHR